LGNGADVYLASAELAAVCSLLGRIPTKAEYEQYAGLIDANSGETYRYLNFDQIASYQAKADSVV
jgi:aconitate hydratase 2/2-methylisocitrate dehydratase